MPTSYEASSAEHAMRHATGGADAVSPASIGAATADQDWQPNTLYVVGQVVVQSGIIYRCAIAHTSGGSFVGTNWAQAAAPITSPALTGTPTAPTATPGTDNTQLATTAYADAAVLVETGRAEGVEATLALTVDGIVTGATATIAANHYTPVDATTQSCTLTLPNAPADKTRCGAKMVITASSHTVTLQCSGSDVINEAGGATTYSLSTLNQGVILEYTHSTGIWTALSDDLALSQLDARYFARQAEVPAYNMTPANFPNLRRMVANIRSGAVPGGTILCAGDSIFAGDGTNDVSKLSIPAILTAMFAADGIPAVQSLSIPTTDLSFDPRWVAGSGWAQANLGFAINGCYYATVGAAGNLSFTPGVNCDTFDVYYHTLTNGATSALLNIDGGASTAVNMNGVYGIHKVTLTVAAGTGHTLNVGTITGTAGNLACILGVDAYLSTAAALRIGNAGVGGANTTEWALQDSINMTQVYGAKVTLLALGVNDSFATGPPLPVAQYIANMTAVIQAIQANGSDVLLWTEPPSSTTSGYNLTVQAQYWAACYQMAQSLNCGLVDINARFGSWVQANNLGFMAAVGGGFAGQVHPNYLGNLDIAAALKNAFYGILGGPIVPTVPTASPGTNNAQSASTAYADASAALAKAGSFPLSTTAEVAISSATALTGADIGLNHACTCAAAYTVTLPTPVGFAGKLIGVRVTPSSTNFLTIATAAGNIDGQSTRIMWAGESAILESDGANWVKIGGKTIPMVCSISETGAQSVANATVTPILLDTTRFDNTGLMATLGSNGITIKRPGQYVVTGKPSMGASAPGNSARCIVDVYKGAAIALQEETSCLSGAFFSKSAADTLTLAAADLLTLRFFQSTGSSWALQAGTITASLLGVVEVPSW